MSMRRGSSILLALSALALLAPARGLAQTSPVFRAMELEDSARWEEAAVLYRSALRTRDGVDAAFGLERALITLGRADELAEVMAALVRDMPDQPLFRAIYVRTLLAAERVDAARAYAREWIAERPFEPEAYRQFYETGPVTADEAIAIWRRVRGAAESDSAARIVEELSQLVLEQGLWPAAREILEHRYERESDPAIAEQVALAAARAGEVERARAVARAAALGEQSAAIAWLALYEGDLVGARRLLRRADEADPDAVLPLAALSRTSQTRSAEFGAGVLSLVRGDTAGAARRSLQVPSRCCLPGRRASTQRAEKVRPRSGCTM